MSVAIYRYRGQSWGSSPIIRMKHDRYADSRYKYPGTRDIAVVCQGLFMIGLYAHTVPHTIDS